MGYKWIFSIVILIVAYFYYKRPSIILGPVIKTESGSIQGIVETSRDGREYYSWHQIPYAQPPVGQLRFSSPKPIKKWEGIRDGSKMGSVCAQADFLFGFSTGSEDCLFVNIHVPKLTDTHTNSRLLPVNVYIHGGAFGMGSGEMGHPAYFMDQDIISVSLNYRLGVLGFLTTGDKNIRGNMGLKDQTLALQWIKKNIQYFGGDANKIQILGQSAGASSVHYLLLSKSTKGLFNTAISMSGAAILPWAFSPTEAAVEKSKAFARKLNCTTDDNAKLTECLRSFDVLDLMNVYSVDSKTISLMYPSKDGVLFVPTVESIDDDEAFLTESPFDIISQGKAHRIPFMSGITRDEGLISSFEFYKDEEALDFFEQNWEKCIENSFHFSTSMAPQKASQVIKKLREFYFPQNKELSREEKISIYTKLFSDGHFLVGSSTSISVQKQFSPVYTYFYNKTHFSILNNLLAEMKNKYHPLIDISIFLGKYLWNQYILGKPMRDYGVFHASDGQMLYPLMNFLHIQKDHQDYQFSKDMVKLFTDFANYDIKRGFVSKLEFRGVKFEPVSKEGKLQYLEMIEEPQVILEPFSERVAFWNSINYSQLFSSKKLK